MNILKVPLFLLFILPLYGHAQVIDFVVKNSSASTLFKLQISSDKEMWSDFGSVNLQPNSVATFQWNTTSESNCIQYLRGKFTRVGWSAIVKVDFCNHPAIQVTFE